MENTLSQEILEIARRLKGSNPGTYFEAGANDGILQSNTHELERALGWAGTLVEPSPEAFNRLVQNRGGRNLLINRALVSTDMIESIDGFFATGSLTGTAHPEIMNFFSGSSTRLHLRERVRRRYRDLRRVFRGAKTQSGNKSLVTVPASSLSRVLLETPHRPIDVFILDVEGMEVDALASLGSEFDARIAIIEVRKPNFLQICTKLSDLGYSFHGFLNRDPDPNRDGITWHRDGVWCQAGDNEAFLAVAPSLSSKT